MTEPTPSRAPTALAPQHLRLFALLVDYLFAVVATNLAVKLLLGAHWDLRTIDPGGPHPGWLLGAAGLLVLRDSVGGRSAGKWLMGIAAVSAADPGAPPPPAARLLRNAALVLLPVEAVLVFTDPYCRRLGDRLAGTVVVSVRTPAPITRRLLGLTILFLVSTLAIFLVEIWNVRRSAAYPVALAAARTHPRVIAELGAPVELSAPGLVRSEDGDAVAVHFSAEGSRGQGRVTVHLRRDAGPRGWQLESIEAKGPPPAAPPPATEPNIQDAPPRRR